MHVAYILYNERPSSGLIQTQVVSLLKEIKSQSPQIDLTLIAFWQPWVAWRFKEQLDNMRSDLEATGIHVEDYPWVIIPSRHFMYSVSLFPILHFWVSRLFHHVLGKRFHIVHCRGYLPSFTAVELKQKLDYRLIFDMRSLWPKEHVTIGAWTVQDSIYCMWDRIEKFTLNNADAAIAVSAPMAEEIERTVPGAKGMLIPICVDTHEFYFDEQARATLRNELIWSQHRIIVYQGSLGLLNRNIHEVGEYFRFILNVCPDLRFLILTSNRSVDIAQIMESYGIESHQYAIRYPQRAELPKWLSAADAGIHAMSPGPDSHTRLGVKVVEYLSCGLPIIVNAHVGAAARLVETYDVGAVIDLANADETRRRVEEVLVQSQSYRERCRRVAQELFSVESCASKYVDLYRSLDCRKE